MIYRFELQQSKEGVSSVEHASADGTDNQTFFIYDGADKKRGVEVMCINAKSKQTFS